MKDIPRANIRHFEFDFHLIANTAEFRCVILPLEDHGADQISTVKFACRLESLSERFNVPTDKGASDVLRKMGANQFGSLPSGVDSQFLLGGAVRRNCDIDDRLGV